MLLPDPIPDNPLKWDGWKLYNSPDPYERLCLDFAKNPSAEQIEENCRLLFVWWQKKLPLKNQPSNPIAQLLRAGLDEAPARIAEARTLLLNPQSRGHIDAELMGRLKQGLIAEFRKFLAFSLSAGALSEEDESILYMAGAKLGLSQAEMLEIIEADLKATGCKRRPKAPAAPPVQNVSVAGLANASPAKNLREEFLRILRLSGVDEITDDQRDAFCNMGEALGMSGGDAEDIIDEYLEERMIQIAPAPAKPVPHKAAVAVAPRPATQAASATPLPATAPKERPIEFSNARNFILEQRKAKPNFGNSLGMQMLLVTSGSFVMGSDDFDAQPIERPPTPTNVSAFFMSRWPVTNGQYEMFDPAHKLKRAPGADEQHPVVYVSYAEAIRFCEWLSKKEGKKYMLPTEAEWEYAAKGVEGFAFPWGDSSLNRGDLANFADANKKLPWADKAIDTGFAATSPIGSFPKGASPFGIEDMAGNVFEWCRGSLFTYPGKEQTNPKGANEPAKRVYRGGSWKSRSGSLRGSARGFNAEAYSANDVGFRVICEA